MSTAGPTGCTPAEIRSAYGFDKTALNGSGTTIAIVDAYDDPKIAGDLHQFDLAFGLPDPVFTKAGQTGSTSRLPKANAGWATEIALDVEWAHAIAPGANILLVEGNSASYGNLMAAANYARSAPSVAAVSMSWGGGEFYGENAYDGYFTTPADHNGVTFLASSGHSGAPVGYPAISPNVVSVGGTTLHLSLNPNGTVNYVSESGWSGSGGGVSVLESQPAYQKGVVTQSTTFRTNPNVSYDSDPNIGFPVYDSYNNSASAPWGQWGGTSDAAPQWAALVAIADQGRLQAGLGTLDGRTQTLPMRYSLQSSDFHDVTGGTSGAVVGKLFDSDGTTQLNAVTASETAITAGGFAFRATGSNKYWDTVQVTPGVNHFAGAATVPLSAAPPATRDFRETPNNSAPYWPPLPAAPAPLSAAADRFSDHVLRALKATVGTAQSGHGASARARHALDAQLVDSFFGLADD